MPKRKCVVLLSGGLDSMLAVRIMQEHGVEVEALNFKTIFTCCQDLAAQSARDLNVPVTVVGQEDDYLQLVREPKHGYGKGANPCVDCRIYMFQKAKLFMEQVQADFVVSGEVSGQRPMSQKRRDLDAIAYHSGLDDLLLRPLSAQLLTPTLPEREGWVDRDRLFGFHGRGRRDLIRLARHLGINEIPQPSTGCALTEPRFSRKVFDLIQSPGAQQRWDFEMLKLGRHFRLDLDTKVVVGRQAAENDHLRYMHELPDANSSVLLAPANFSGASAVLIGPATDTALEFASSLIWRYSQQNATAPAIRVTRRDGVELRSVTRNAKVDQLETIAGKQLQSAN